MCGNYFFCCQKLLEPLRNFKKTFGKCEIFDFFPPNFEVFIRSLFVKFIIFSEWSSLIFHNVLSLPNNVTTNVKINIDNKRSRILWKTRSFLKYMYAWLNNYVATLLQRCTGKKDVVYDIYLHVQRILNFSIISLKYIFSETAKITAA